VKTPLTSRLAVRVYLVGLGQTAVIAAGFVAIMDSTRPKGPGPGEAVATYLAESLVQSAGNRAEIEHEVDRIGTRLRSVATIYDPEGKVVLSSDATRAVRCEVPPEGRSGERPRACVGRPARLHDGRDVTIEVQSFGGPPPPSDGTGLRILALVLAVIGLSAWLLARSLTKPLSRMAEAARAFGSGDLKARVGSSRRDEIGEVSRAFDDMAARVTELLRAEKELLANVSHELRTPLARIRVALDLANEGDSTMLQESLVDIGVDLNELETLIADVLTAARLELDEGPGSGGLPPLRRERLAVSELVDQAATRFRGAHPERVLVVRNDVDGVELEADRILLRRVVDNLLENAHKYTPDTGAPIELDVRTANDHLVIDIVDRGVGIAAEDVPRVFRPFFRVDRSRTRATGGLGLGLALSKRIVEAHGGTIAIASVPDEGTTVTVDLPIDA
jgi:two-component system OmpR family sensor kinase